MPGKGNGHTKLVSFENAIELIMVLPGKVAKKARAKFANIIRRYLAGDKSLTVETSRSLCRNRVFSYSQRFNPKKKFKHRRYITPPPPTQTESNSHGMLQGLFIRRDRSGA